MTDAQTLKRIKSLVIPPAWTEVWICANAQGHLQAVGRDARGRKQYRYHPKWRQTRDEAKFGRTIAFARALPKIRRGVAKSLKRRGLPREKILALVVRLLEATLIRVGNEEYARGNDSYGLTTLQDRHAVIRGGKVSFRFRGKSGISHEIALNDARLARIIKQSQDLPGQELFQYVDEDGRVRDITSADVNAYLRTLAGDEFTAKDFRTWAGTVLAARALRDMETAGSATAAKRSVVRAVEEVAKKLGNTPAVCRKCYIHPAIVNSYLDGTLRQSLGQRVKQLVNAHDLNPDEKSVLDHLLQAIKHGDPPAKHPRSPRQRAA